MLVRELDVPLGFGLIVCTEANRYLEGVLGIGA
jgi:hypothetical protein